MAKRDLKALAGSPSATRTTTVPRDPLLVFGACIVRTTPHFARAEFVVRAPFAPTIEPAPPVTVCLFFGHVSS